MNPQKLLKILETKGYKKIGSYRRNKSFIYLKKGKQVAIPFSLTDESFNDNIENILLKGGTR